MAMAPGKRYIGSPIAFTANFQSAAGSDVDPTTVTFWTLDPSGCQTSYVYGTDDEVVKDSVGDYTATIIPDSPGRWFYKWITTGTNLVVVDEGNFLVQDSPFYEGESGYV
jgi:hypothetical protein